MKICELDVKILKLLLQDGRRSFTDIAQTCGTTKSQIWKHYKIMEKNGIITGSTIQMNFDIFGYDALVNLLISVEAQQIEQVMNCIGRITEVHAYRQYNNIYNIRAVAILRNLNDLDYVKSAIRRQLPMIAIRTYIWTAVRNIPENLQIMPIQKNIEKNDETIEDTIVLSQTEKPKIDELDLQIVDQLTINGRMPFSKIAEKLNISTDTVLKRYHKLRKKGAMKVSIQINPNKIGYHAILDFNIASTSPVNSSTTVGLLSKIPDVIIVTRTSGDYDLQLTAMIRDVEQFFRLQEEIARTPGVTKIETSARKIPSNWPTQRQHISTF